MLSYKRWIEEGIDGDYFHSKSCQWLEMENVFHYLKFSFVLNRNVYYIFICRDVVDHIIYKLILYKLFFQFSTTPRHPHGVHGQYLWFE